MRIVVLSLCMLGLGLASRVEAARMGRMQANQILFLGNSITFCPQPTSEDWWGLSASDPDHDYAHLLVQKINQTTGGILTIVPPDPPQGTPPDGGDGETRWEAGDPPPNYTGNIINVCDIFELSFDTWENVRIQNQLDLQPDIVVIQLGENTNWQGRTLEQFRTGLDTMLTGLKNSSNPHIFVTGYVLGSNWPVDEIKRQLCAEDPDRRVFVDLSMIGQNPAAYIGAYGHPNDLGMSVIADTIYAAMEAHSAPEPCTMALIATGMLFLQTRTRRKRIR